MRLAACCVRDETRSAVCRERAAQQTSEQTGSGRIADGWVLGRRKADSRRRECIVIRWGNREVEEGVEEAIVTRDGFGENKVAVGGSPVGRWAVDSRRRRGGMGWGNGRRWWEIDAVTASKSIALGG